MRVLVTGSSGHIGSVVAARLARESEVAGIDLQPGPHTTHVGDIADRDLVRAALRRVDAVVHTAALHAPHVTSASVGEFERTNVEATRTLLELAAICDVTRLVLTSTTSVYGCTSRAGTGTVWVTESLAPHPEDIYDRTKLAAEASCREASSGALSTVILRVSRCFPESPHLVAFYRMFRGVARHDVAEAHALAVLAPLRGNSLLNISAQTPFLPEDTDTLSHDPWSVIERRVPGVRAAFEHRGWPLPSRIDRVYAIASARQILGFAPRYGVLELLRADAA
jgi:UDP-glucose 4-epimerase